MIPKRNVIPLYDENGFAIIRRMVPAVSLHGSATMVKHGSKYGMHEILRTVEADSKIIAGSKVFADRYEFLDSESPWDIKYEPKTWQRKAWDHVVQNMDWKAKSGFSNCTENEKLSHILRIGISLIIRCDDRNKEHVVLDTFEPEECTRVGSYNIIDNYSQFKRIMSKWYQMVVNDIDKYRDKAKIMYDQCKIVYLQKAIIIYDDRSYDALTSNPLELLRVLEIGFIDGKFTPTVEDFKVLRFTEKEIKNEG